MIKADLHLHSCLSPCADITMVPGVVSQKADSEGIDILSITDHNACNNVKSFKKRLYRLLLPGVELTSLEEVHVLAYFSSFEKLDRFCKYVRKFLPVFPYDPELMGYQVVVNEKDEFVKVEEIFLGSALQLRLKELVDTIIFYEGVPVYAHIERRFGILYQLGVFPKDDRVKVVEARTREGWKKAIDSGFVVLSNSDAHTPDEIGCRFTRFKLHKLNLKEVFSVLSIPKRERILSIWDCGP